MAALFYHTLVFYKRLNSADNEIHDMQLLNDDLAEIVYKRDC